MEVASFLNLEKVTVKSFDEILFKNLNLKIARGEQWAVTGNNDVAASQFLEIFKHKYTISEGNLDLCFFNEFKEHNPLKDPVFNSGKLISYVAQKHNFKNLSNLSEFYYQQRYNAQDADNAPTVEAYLLNVTSCSEKPYWTFNKTIERLHLNHLKNKSLIKLSHGETKRLLIAAALLKNPVLLLLDHPYSGLDSGMRNNLNEIINEIIHSGVTIILAAAPHEIPETITHVAVLENKEIAATFLRQQFKKSVLQQEKQEISISESALPFNALRSYQKFEYVVKMHNVTIRYDNKIILNKITWSIKQGERWALLGPNGAGKTTLLSLINGDNPQAYANDIIIFDRKKGSGESVWDIKEKIGFMSPELYQYFPSDFSCLQIVESGFYDSIGLYRKSNPENAFISKKWMETLKIKNYADHNFSRTPSNIQRLCLMARALVKNPPLLLLDEPCHGLEQHQKQSLKHLIDKICNISKITLIYVTHYKEEIPSKVNKLIKLENGEMIYSGEFDERMVSQ